MRKYNSTRRSAVAFRGISDLTSGREYEGFGRSLLMARARSLHFLSAELSSVDPSCLERFLRAKI